MEVAKCPYCGYEVKFPSREWKYSVFIVKRFDCPNCGKWFREYYRGESLKFILILTDKGLRKPTG
jgi:transcriptional regulator NrdR family protein